MRSKLLCLAYILPKVVHEKHFSVENALLHGLRRGLSVLALAQVWIVLSFESHEDRLKEESEVDQKQRLLLPSLVA